MKNYIFAGKLNKEKPTYLLIIILGIQVFFAYLISNTSKNDNAFTHIMYLPIVLAGFIFDYRIGILSGLIGELLISVFDPSSISLNDTDQMQAVILRSICFMLAGLIVGIYKNHLEEAYTAKHRHKSFCPYTNLPNWDAFIEDTYRTIRSTKKVNFRLILIEVSNQNDLLATFGIDVVYQISNELIEKIQRKYKFCKLYLIRSNSFGMVLFNIHEDINSLINLFEQPLLINGIPIYCEITMGEASYPESGYSSEDLLKNSFLALNVAKTHKKPYQQYKPQLYSQEIPVLLGQFQNAIQSGEIDFHYQPIITKFGDVCALEALVRWNHPVKGMVPPNDFIPDLEFTRLTNSLTYYSIDINLTRTARLLDEGFDLRISLNISITNLFQQDFIERFMEILEKHQFPADHVTLEITERGFLSDETECQNNLNALYKHGVNISIDDFGVGFTSISNFHNKGIDSIKIDRSFIQNIHNNEGNQAILKGLIAIAKSSNIRVIAEGIEVEQENEKVLELGVDCLQGYYIAKPMNFNSTLRWLNGYSKNKIIQNNQNK